MGKDKKLETMSEEIKLLKGELKQSLASVRDYLLNMELPTSEFSNILEALDSGEGQKVTMSGTLAVPQDTKASEEIREEFIEVEPETPSEDDKPFEVEEPPAEPADTLEENIFAHEDRERHLEEPLLAENEPGEDNRIEASEEPKEALEPEPELSPEPEPELPLEPEYKLPLEPKLKRIKETKSKTPLEPESKLSLEENLPMDIEKITTEANQTTPKVNMLANLMSWAARAKKEIGYNQIPTLLEVYGISGHLSAELKEVIMHLADITTKRPEVANDAEVWGEAMLSLHGILTGGDAPLHPLVPFAIDASGETPPSDEGTTDEEKPKEVPFKLKLVFPNGDGEEKEFCINLTPEEDDGGSSPKQRKN